MRVLTVNYYRPRSHRVEVAASGDPRANGDSTLKFANQTKSICVGLLIAPENTTPVPADTGYHRPRSHHVEVAASWDPRANEESTLKSANRDAFPLRELRVSQQTGDTENRFWKNIEICSYSPDFRYKSHIDFDISQVLPTQVPPRGVHYRRTFNRAREHHACARRHTRECPSYPTRIPRGYIEIREEEEKTKRKRGIEEEKEKKQMRREESKSVRTRKKDEAEKKRKKRISVRCNETYARVKKMKLERKDGHGKEKKRKDILEQNQSTKIQLDYSLEFDRKDLGKIFKNAAICTVILAAYKISIYNKYCRPRSHRVEVAASGDPRTNGDSTSYYFYYYQESKATGRPPLPTNSSLQTLKLQPHASPHLGTDLRIAQLSNTGSFDHHLSTTGRAFTTNAGIQN
ncbi:hypothetical protein V1477_005870 [Vespula maculifrons]|uniref:Uncharacterized protein n=1 Tax=Vespula maculifrons TaxID=7453 RepID=A0ABD2CLH0_VESMC